MKSPIYWHPGIYHLAMKLSYKKKFEERYRNIEKIIPAGASVTEVCMGDAYLYRTYLSRKNVKYTGLDINETFVKSAQKESINAHVHNLLTDVIPASDYVVMHAGLFQFIPNHHFVIKKLLDAARRFLIVSEPIKNLADSQNALLSFLAKHAVNPGNGPIPYRFNRTTLRGCFDRYKAEYEITEIENGLELIGVFRKK